MNPAQWKKSAYPVLQIFPPHLWSDCSKRTISTAQSTCKHVKYERLLTEFDVDSCFGIIRAVMENVRFLCDK